MTADRARGALAVLQDADGKFICEVPCGYIVEQTASAHKPRRIQAQRRRRAMLRRRVALTVALLTVAALLAALMPWSGSGAADKPKDTTAGTLEEVHQPTAVLLPSSGTVAEYVPNAAEVEALAKLIYGEAGIVPSTTEQAAVVWCVLNRVDDPRFPDTVLEVIEAPYGAMREQRRRLHEQRLCNVKGLVLVASDALFVGRRRRPLRPFGRLFEQLQRVHRLWRSPAL